MKKVTNLYYNRKDGAAGGLLGPDKLQKNQKNLRKSEIKDFFENDPVARLFYGKPKLNRKKNERNTSVSHPLQILHMDLISFVNEPYTTYRYGLTCIDSYSRYAILIPIKTKSASSVRSALSVLIKELKPFRRLPSMKQSIFYCDLGKEFTSNQQFLRKKNHKIVFATSGKSKAYFAERFHAVVRRQLTLLRLKEGDQKFLAREGWAKYAPLITKIHNKTQHASLNRATPIDVINLRPAALKRIQDWKKNSQGSNPYKTWKNSWKKQKQSIEKYLHQYVRLVVIPSQIFAKKSQQYKLGYELFTVTSVRPTKGDHSKSILLHLTDRENETIQGVFRLDEVHIVPKESIFHPNHPHYKPTISQVVEKVKNGRGQKYKVRLAGNTYTDLTHCQRPSPGL